MDFLQRQESARNALLASTFADWGTLAIACFAEIRRHVGDYVEEVIVREFKDVLNEAEMHTLRYGSSASMLLKF